METLKKYFGRRCRILRESRGFSRESLSQYVDIDPQSIYRLEKGEQWIAPEKLENLANFYKVSPAVFFTDDVVKIHPTPQEALEVLRGAIQGSQDPLAVRIAQLDETGRKHLLQGILAEEERMAESGQEERKRKS